MLLEDIRSFLSTAVPVLEEASTQHAEQAQQLLARIDKLFDRPGERQLLASLVEHYDQGPMTQLYGSYDEFASDFEAPNGAALEGILRRLVDQGYLDGSLGPGSGSIRLTSYGRDWCRSEHGL